LRQLFWGRDLAYWGAFTPDRFDVSLAPDELAAPLRGGDAGRCNRSDFWRACTPRSSPKARRQFKCRGALFGVTPPYPGETGMETVTVDQAAARLSRRARPLTLTTGATVSKILRSVAEGPIRIIVALAKGRRYFPLIPSVLTRQVLFDRKQRRFIKIEIRDHVDFHTLSQIYLAEDYGIDRFRRQNELITFYRSMVGEGRIPLIIDCGANIGLASRYFSENYPEARIICIEPDRANLIQAKRNNTSANISFLEAAVGGEKSRGTIVDPGLGSDAYRVRHDENGATEIVSINDLLRQYDEDKFAPFIVKIDIEGSESDLFSGKTEWIEKFPLLIIELHDWLFPRSGNARNFLKEVAPLDRDFLYHGENIFSISNTVI
jgi:FkbM family methyltransferase